MRNSASFFRGAAPETPRFVAVAPESLCSFGAASTAPAIPASESTLGSHLCVALPSAQVLSEWTLSTPPDNGFSLNGNDPLNLLSHSKGSLQVCSRISPLPYPWVTVAGSFQRNFVIGPGSVPRRAQLQLRASAPARVTAGR